MIVNVHGTTQFSLAVREYPNQTYEKKWIGYTGKMTSHVIQIRKKGQIQLRVEGSLSSTCDIEIVGTFFFEDLY